MARKSEKTLSGLKLNFFQWTENEIRVTIQNPFEGKQALITSVEHTNRHHGKNKARTHNNIFNFFKEVLDANGKWKEIKETNLGKKRNLSVKEEIDLENKYGFIYITTNLLNGMKYVGKHSRNDDTYLGSGVRIKAAIEEFGEENFEREIIAYAYTSEQLNELEKMYIDTFNAVEDATFYNLAPGGDGWYKKISDGIEEEVY
ncbi:GIY-YIG nuclease family protein [Neobacillus drentensis]|uniref:GIY-YIG nuclease family protein n=1 Tax=Neobacillus drentensis TaxID=220684 RepID=UPI002FFFA795